MKLCISNIAWNPEESFNIVTVLNRLSVRVIEVAPTLLFDDVMGVNEQDVLKVKDEWKRRGFDIVAMQALLYGRPDLVIFEDEGIRVKLLRYLEKVIWVGGTLGAGPLVFGSPKNRRIGELSKNQAMDIAIEFFSELGRIARRHGTVVCIEPNAAEYGCDFVQNTNEAVDLVEAVGDPGIAVHLDSGVMCMNGEQYEESLETAFSFLRHFHISEPYLGLITEAKSDHARLGSCLKRLGYQGYVSIEMKSGLKRSNVEAVQECIEYAAEQYLG